MLYPITKGKQKISVWVFSNQLYFRALASQKKFTDFKKVVDEEIERGPDNEDFSSEFTFNDNENKKEISPESEKEKIRTEIKKSLLEEKIVSLHELEATPEEIFEAEQQTKVINDWIGKVNNNRYGIFTEFSIYSL